LITYSNKVDSYSLLASLFFTSREACEVKRVKRDNPNQAKYLPQNKAVKSRVRSMERIRGRFKAFYNQIQPFLACCE
jgi:hypothetical protein